VATGSSVIGGFYHYANLLLRDATGHVYSAVLLATLVTSVSMGIAYRDVKISARLMLWIEAASVSVIVIVVALLLARHGWHLDGVQLQLQSMTGSGLRLGLVLASLASRVRPRWDRKRATRFTRFHALSFKVQFSPALSSQSAPTRRYWDSIPPAGIWARARLQCMCWLELAAYPCWDC
jgi:hypothetical protein